MCNGKTLALIFNTVKDFALVHALNISLYVKHFPSASGVHVVVNFSSQVIFFWSFNMLMYANKVETKEK